MKIRQLYAYELRPAAALVMETYSRMEQPYVANPKEIEDFKRYADEDHLWVESCKNKLFLFGAFDDNDQMCAVGAIDAAGAVTLLYAGLNFQHRGLEAEVLREMEEFATVGRSIAREEIKIPGKWMQYTATAGAPLRRWLSPATWVFCFAKCGRTWTPMRSRSSSPMWSGGSTAISFPTRQRTRKWKGCI